MKYIIVLLFSIGLSAQSFDFECLKIDSGLQQFFDDFIQDGRDREYNFNEEDLTQGFLKWAVLEGSRRGTSEYSCSPGFRVRIDSVGFDEYRYLRQKRVIYHELGHAVLRLEHTSWSSFNGTCNLIEQNIMNPGSFNRAELDANNECLDTSVRNNIVLFEDKFIQSVDRLFSGLHQIHKQCN